MRSPQLAKLQSRLAARNSAPISGMQPDLTAIGIHIRKLRKYLNGEGGAGGRAAPRDRILEAARSFATTGDLADCKQARLATWSLLLPYDPRAPSLIEDVGRFEKFLASIESFKSDVRCFRRCWRGLLHTYFAYGPDGPGKTNWTALREYLRMTLGRLKGPGFIPDWAHFISEHANLLTDDPTGRYGDDLADGDTSVIEQFRNVLGVSDDSWLSSSLIEAQIRAIVAREDDAFRQMLPSTIDLLQKHNLLADAALAQLLERYHRCANLELNISLRDYSSLRWGPPWLQMNTAKWGRVSDDVRRMVEGWLKLDFIEKFFALLSADGVNDPRRLIFWRALHEHIGDMYFALGRTATENKSADFKDIRQKMRGRILNLEDTTSDNNAFIMQIGQYLFVEYGEKGNALYIYERSKLPFDLSRSYISIKQLRNLAKAESRLIHKDTLSGRWEDLALAKISSLTDLDLRNFRSGRRAPLSSAQKAAAQQPSTTNPRPQPSSAYAKPPVAPQIVKSFCDFHGLKYQDLTEKGGQFWVSAPQTTSYVSRELAKWGFRYSAKRNAWYRAF